jgi:hypothetical protein
MLILRIIGVLAVIAIGVNLLLWLFTANRRYLQWSWNIGRAALVFALAVMVLFMAERLILI